MIIRTPDGWQSLTGKAAPPITEAATYRELSAKMADELAELIPSMGGAAASRAVKAMLSGALSR